MKIKKFRKIFIAGQNGMVGSALYRFATKNRLSNEIIKLNRKDIDFLDKKKTFNFLKKQKPDIVFICAAKVGGILANNNYPVDFLLNNLEIQNNLISGCFEANIDRVIFFGSSCIYPKHYYKKNKSFKEEHMLSGNLELTNEPYAIAKIAGIKLCESYNRQYNRDYRSIIPCNLYGPNDNFHPDNSHVLAALIKKFIYAKKNNHKLVKIWGTGNVKREFLHVDDLANASFILSSLSKVEYKSLTAPQQSFLNVGSGQEISIKELCKIISKTINYECKLDFDLNKPDGTKSKVLNIKKILSLGWKPQINLYDGIREVVKSNQYLIK